MAKKVLLSDMVARVLLMVGDEPGLTTKELIKKLKSGRPPTVYAILNRLTEKNMFLVQEQHSGMKADGRPSRTYTLSPNGERHAGLYRKLFALKETK